MSIVCDYFAKGVLSDSRIYMPSGRGVFIFINTNICMLSWKSNYNDVNTPQYWSFDARRIIHWWPMDYHGKGQ